MTSSGRSYVVAIDQGTTSSRVILFDHAGAIVATAQKEHTQHFPQPAWVEHDAEEIWTKVQQCIKEALASAGAGPHQCVAVGITNQRETVVVWNRETGRPYHHALVWQDQRGAPACTRMAAGSPLGADRFRHKTGLPIFPYFSASKLAWLLDNVPGLRADAEAGVALAGTVDAWLVWQLTRLHVTDVTNASRTLLCNIHTGTWDDELLKAWGVPRAMLPQIEPSVHVYGRCRADSLLPGVPLAGILGDQQAALFGQACFEPGEAKNTYGTGCFMLMNTGTTPVTSTHGLVTTIAYQVGDAPPVYALEGSVAVAGSVVTWLRDNLRCVEGSGVVESVAASVPDSGGVTFVPAFNGLFAPRWRSDARGILIGLTGHTQIPHIVRAALESVAFQSKEVLDAMAKDARPVIDRHAFKATDLRVDGGMTVNNLLMQVQSDVIGRRVVRPVVSETTALGAAYAAGLAVGFWKDTAELKRQWQVGRVWTPGMAPNTLARLQHRWDAAVKRSIGWAGVGEAAATAAAATTSDSATPASTVGGEGAPVGGPTKHTAAATTTWGAITDFFTSADKQHQRARRRVFASIVTLCAGIVVGMGLQRTLGGGAGAATGGVDAAGLTQRQNLMARGTV